MKICTSCCKYLPQGSFSKKQWRSGETRRCAACINNNEEQKTPPPKEELESREPGSETRGEVPSCVICMCEGPDEFGQPLQRDCSCRGEDSGFVHFRCIVDYAKTKSMTYDGSVGKINGFRRAWEICLCCNQTYVNELALDLATEFVMFVRTEMPNDLVRNMEAMVYKLETLQHSVAFLTPKQRNMARQLGGNILKVTTQIKACVSNTFHQRALLGEAVTHNALGRILLSDNTKESARLAENSFQKCLLVNIEIGNHDGTRLAQTYIAIAKSKYDGCDCQASVLENLQKLYMKYIETFGQENPTTITAGVDLAIHYLKVEQVIECERLLGNLIPIATRVHGKDHRQTRKAVSILRQAKVRYVMVNHHLQWQSFEALRYEDDGARCVLQGPIESPRNIKEEQIISVEALFENGCYLGYFPDTPVVCFGLKTAQHLNGAVGELKERDEMTGRYKVQFEDKNLKPRMIKPKNVRIVFELSDMK